MNPQMRLVVMLAIVWASGSLLFAAEPAAPPAEPASEPAAAAKSEQQADAAPASESVSEEEKDPEPTRAPDDTATTADRTRSPQRFTPSEQVRADFDVSFPIDI